jgi:hypothetical protein
LGVRSIMLLHHLLRYTFAVLSSLAHPQGSARTEVGKQVSGACLRELISGSVPNRVAS